MKNLLMIGLLCLTFFAGQETFAQETSKKEPTKSETASWLQEKFRGFIVGISRGKKIGANSLVLNFKTNSFSFGDCDMSFAAGLDDITGNLGGTIELKDIDSSRIKSFEKNSDGEWGLRIFTHNNEQNFNLGGIPELNKSSVIFHFSEEHVRDRVVVALKAAIKQCGGDEEKEPF